MNWIFVVFLLLILCSVKKVGRQGGEASVYTKPVSNSIKGVAAILIVLHHIAWKLEEANIIVWFYREINLFAVGIFLFFSGFGLVKSYEARGGIQGNSVIKYISRLLLSYFTVFLFKLLMDSCSIKIDYSIIKSVLTLQMPPSQLWYLKAQMVCYLLFIISGYFFKEDYHRMALAVFTPILLWTFVGAWQRVHKYGMVQYAALLSCRDDSRGRGRENIWDSKEKVGNGYSVIDRDGASAKQCIPFYRKGYDISFPCCIFSAALCNISSFLGSTVHCLGFYRTAFPGNIFDSSVAA